MQSQAAGRAHTKGGQVMFRPQPLLVLPRETERWQGARKRRTSVRFTLNHYLGSFAKQCAGRAYTKGGQVMFRPRPLLQLPCTGALRPAPALGCSLRAQWHPRAPPNSTYLPRVGRNSDARLEVMGSLAKRCAGRAHTKGGQVMLSLIHI